MVAVESLATILVHCLTVSVYTYFVYEVAFLSLRLVVLATTITPPKDILSLLCIVWIGLITLSIFLSSIAMLKRLFFAGYLKKEIENLQSTTIIVLDEKRSVKHTCFFKEGEDAENARLLSLLSVLKVCILGTNRSTSPLPDSTVGEKSDSTEQDLKTSDDSVPSVPVTCEAKFTEKCPGTPNSQAVTEKSEKI